jgi:hypothetical protein
LVLIGSCMACSSDLLYSLDSSISQLTQTFFIKKIPSTVRVFFVQIYA